MPGWKERKHYAGICPKYLYDDEGLAGLFTAAERKAYEDARTYKAMKNRISLDSPELQAPVHLSWRSGGTYTNYHLVSGERVTKSKFWLYAEQGIFYYRYLMRLVDGKWMVDNAQWCREGRWSFCGL